MGFITDALEQSSYEDFFKSERKVIFRSIFEKYLSLIKSDPSLWEQSERADQIKVAAEELNKYCVAATKEYEELVRYYIRDLGQQRIDLLKHLVNDFFYCLKQLEQRYKEKFYKIETDANISSDMRQQFIKMEEFVNNLKTAGKMEKSEIAGSTLMVATSGVAAAIGTPAAVTAAVGSLATASTGTAISTLGGAAAQNAILAWLGGGSIASGGGGIAAGPVVLGSITTVATGGVLLIAGTLTYAWHASKKLTDVVKQAAEIAENAKKIERSWAVFDGILKRTQEIKNITEKLAAKAKTSFSRLKQLVDIFDCENDIHAKAFQETAFLMKALIDIINAQILDEEGNLSAAGLNVIETTKRLIKNTELGNL